MRYLLLLLLPVATVLASFDTYVGRSPRPYLDHQWKVYKQYFHKKYPRKRDDLLRRLAWEKSVEIMCEHNLEYDIGNASYELTINRYSDATESELRQIHQANLGRRKPQARWLVTEEDTPYNVPGILVTRPPTKYLDRQWKLYKKLYGKTYPPNEDRLRRKLWERTVEIVCRHNLDYYVGTAKNLMSLTDYADLLLQNFWDANDKD
ncbi:uncharacterized protein LOC135367493 [Ornithodoros turicata]|uniref:uncharacterized protein LOC135367493 n=1 Tax=Ornithodoros turicata TaxID=34597 RepID=UPI003139AF99